MSHPRPLLVYFQSFSNKHYNVYNKLIQKMSIQYAVQGFEPTTFRTRVWTHSHYSRAPPNVTLDVLINAPTLALLQQIFLMKTFDGGLFYVYFSAHLLQKFFRHQPKLLSTDVIPAQLLCRYCFDFKTVDVFGQMSLNVLCALYAQESFWAK